MADSTISSLSTESFVEIGGSTHKTSAPVLLLSSWRRMARMRMLWRMGRKRRRWRKRERWRMGNILWSWEEENPGINWRRDFR